MSAAQPTQFPHQILRASAGTGKTFQLSNRFLGLLNDGVPGDSILATTFTRKAAGEILDRVLVRLAKAALHKNAADELGGHLKLAGLTRERCLTLIRETAKNLHRLRIGTLDSFFAQLARSFGLDLGLPPGWEIADEAEDARLRREAVSAVLRKEDTADLKTLMSHLTKGETTRGVSELVHATVSDLYGLYQETPAEAWHTLPRYPLLSSEELQAVLVELRDATLPKRMQTPRDKDVEIAASGDWDAFISKGLTAKVLDGSCCYYKVPIPAGVVALYQKLLGQAQAVLVGKIVNQTESTYKLLEKFDAEYQRVKRERRALRFEDVTRQLEAVSLMEDVGRLAFRLDAHVDQLLLDEFQDTSPPQWRVLRPFAKRITAGAKCRSFFCVGDVKQAIYGWRGGVAEIFDSVTSELPGLSSLPLTRSFRSAQPVIDTVNKVFTRLDVHPDLNREVKGVQLWSSRFEAHTTAKAELSGYVGLETSPQVEEGEVKKHAQLAYAARRIAELVKETPGRQIGVLLRSNEGVARLVFELRSLGVAASEEGGNPLTDSAAVQIILSLLRLADHPGDSVARFHVEHTPLATIFDGDAFRVQVLGVKNRLDALRVSQAVRRALADEGYGPTLRKWAEALLPSCNRRELARLAQLVELAYGYDAKATLRADDFVEYVRGQKVADPTGANVRVMTIHQAKGLEFEIVVLPQLEGRLIGQSESFVVHRPDPAGPVERVCRYAGKEVRQLMPDSVTAMFEAADDRDVTESLCVLYVALTRAARALYMIIPPSLENEGTHPKTFAGMLRATLFGTGAAPPQTKLYEHGDPRWYTHDGDAVGNALRGVPVGESADGTRSVPATLMPATLTVALAPNAARRTRGLERVAPSGLEGGSRIALSKVFSGDSNRIAMDRGTLVHAFFEQIAWLDDGRPSDVVLRAAAERAIDHSTGAKIGIEKTLVEFRAMLDRPAIAQALSRGAYDSPRTLGLPSEVERELRAAAPRLVVHNERTFALRREESQLLQGSIDRLVLLYAGDKIVAADVLDYKTDTIPAGDAAALRAKVDYYKPQLDAYRASVAQLFRLPENRVTARLLFVGAGLVEPV